MEVGRRDKIQWYVTRGVGSENGVGVWGGGGGWECLSETIC